MRFKWSGHLREIFELVSALLLLIALILLSRNVSKMTAGTADSKEHRLVVLDAGHGGGDPGKVGGTDVYEKDMNLAVAQKVKQKLKKAGFRVVMTREKDEMLGGGGSKVEDMKARVALINKKEPAITVSIHQNSYHDEEVSGAQVFYYTHSPEGESAARVMQEALLLADPDNHRQAKANDTYYLLKRTKGTTVIVECGFLSNPEEAKLLQTEAYQEKMAEAIAQGVVTYLKGS